MDEITFPKNDEQFQAAIDRVLAAERSALRQPSRAEVEAALSKWLGVSILSLLGDAAYWTHGPNHSTFSRDWEAVRPLSPDPTPEGKWEDQGPPDFLPR